MQILYFPDIDTLELAFDRMKPVHRTVDGPNDSILMDFDAEGRLMGLTIDSASQTILLEALRESPHFEICEQERPLSTGAVEDISSEDISSEDISSEDISSAKRS